MLGFFGQKIDFSNSMDVEKKPSVNSEVIFRILSRASWILDHLWVKNFGVCSNSQIIFKVWNLNRWKLLLSCMIFLMPTQDNKCHHLLGSEKNGWSVALGQTIFADLVWLLCTAAHHRRPDSIVNPKSDNKFAIRTHFCRLKVRPFITQWNPHIFTVTNQKKFENWSKSLIRNRRWKS